MRPVVQRMGIVGTVTSEPKLGAMKSGYQYCSWLVHDPDLNQTFEVSVWGDVAPAYHRQLKQGQRMAVHGMMRQPRDGVERISADSIHVFDDGAGIN